MAVGTIFSSETKIEILRVLASSNRSYSAKELTKETTKKQPSIYNALNSLRQEGVLHAIREKGTTFYRLETAHPMSEAIEALFETEKKRYRFKNLPIKTTNILLSIKKQLVNQIDGLEKIILFGSAARGDFTPQSDIDLYIVVDESGTELENDIYDLADGYDHEFSLIIRSRDEFRSDFEEPKTSLASSITTDGSIVIYDKTPQEQGENDQFFPS